MPSPPEGHGLDGVKMNGVLQANGNAESFNEIPSSSQWENIQPGRHYRLKLLCKDECKGAVTAVCSMNGYLVSSMGQKVGSRTRRPNSSKHRAIDIRSGFRT